MKITLIYMAAGNSRRFGGNKLLYPLAGKPMYRHLLDRLLAVCARHTGWEIVLVTQYGEIAEDVSGLPLACVLSPDSEKGISHSIRAGISASPDACAWVFFAADQPFFTEESAEGFLLAMERSAAELGAVTSGGERGNPVWFSRKYREELLSLEGDTGGRRILKAHPEAVTLYEIADPRELSDIDTRDNI